MKNRLMTSVNYLQIIDHIYYAVKLKEDVQDSPRMNQIIISFQECQVYDHLQHKWRR